MSKKKEKVINKMTEEIMFIVDNQRPTCGAGDIKREIDDYLEGVELKTPKEQADFVMFIIAVAFPKNSSEETRALMDRLTAIHQILMSFKASQTGGGTTH